MYIDFAHIFNKGFNTWKQNPHLCLPIILNITTFVTLAIILLGTYLLLIDPITLATILITPLISSIGNISGTLIQQLLIHPLESLIFIIISILILNLPYSFFTAGSIGMSHVAISQRKVSFKHMLEYGRKNLKTLYLTNLFILFIFAIGIIFLIPSISVFLNQTPSAVNLIPENQFLLSFFLGISIFSLYLFILGILFSLTPYAIVIGNLSLFKSLHQSVHLVWNNKLNTFLIIIIILVLGSLLWPLNLLPQIGYIIYLLLNLTIFSPLAILWWCRYYNKLTE